MNKISPVQAQFTIAQYLTEVIQNKVVFKPYDNYRLLIDPKLFGLSRAYNQTEQDYFNLVIDAYIQHLDNTANEFYNSTNDYTHRRQVNRTLNRLKTVLRKHQAKQNYAPNWAIEFYMPNYGIDVQRQIAVKRKAERTNNPTPKPLQTDIIAIAIWYEIAIIQPSPFEDISEQNVQKRRAFRSELDFKIWCESEPIKSKDIQLQTIKNLKCIDDVVINADQALEHLSNILNATKH